VASIRTITAPIWSEKPSRLPDAARVAGFALAVLLLEALLARGVSGPEVARYVYLFVGLFVVALVFRFPLATAVVLFGLIDFVFPTELFSKTVGPITVKPHEVALACLLIVAFVRPKRHSWGGTPGIALAVFLAFATVSAAISVINGDTSLSDAFNWSRSMGLLTFFYVIVRLFPDAEGQRVLLTAIGALAALTGVIAALVAFGAVSGSFLEGTDTNTITSEGLGSIQRVRLAGLSAGYALFWYAVVRFALGQGPKRLLWGLAVAGITLDIAVSFNRNMWLGLLIGAALMAIFGGSIVRHRLAVGAAVAVAGIAALMVFGSSSTSDEVVQPIVKRGATLFTPSKTRKESSLEDRARETSAAWEVARDKYLIGIGAGTPFGVYSTEAISSGSFIIGTTQIPQLFLHNQYLYLLLIAGLPGLIAFVVFLAVPMMRAFQRPVHDAAITSLGVGIALVMISSVVAIYFVVDDMTAILGLIAGLIVADSEGPAREGEPSGLAG
jgi:O-antigen ligase